MKNIITEFRGLFIRVDGCCARYVWFEEENKWLKIDHSSDSLRKCNLPVSFDEKYRLMLVMKYSQ